MTSFLGAGPAVADVVELAPREARRSALRRGVPLRVALRFAQAVPLLLGVLVISFFLTHVIPGDPARTIAGPFAPAAQVDALRRQLGLDKPLMAQFGSYLAGLARGDLGHSLTSGAPVSHELATRAGSTLELIILGTALATIYGVAVGAGAAWWPRFRRFAHGLMIAGLATPDFVLGLVLLYLLFFRLRLAPAPVGQIDLTQVPPPRVTGAIALDALLAGQGAVFVSALKHLVLPVLTLALVYGTPIARIAESAFLEARSQKFVEYANLVGLRRRRIFAYLMRASLARIVTLSGVTLGYLLGGAVLVEIVFSWGGLGQYAASAILARDIPAIQGFLLVAGAFTLLIYLLLDLLYDLLDPRLIPR